MKYLNESGLARLWSNTKSLIDTKATKAITLGGYGITDAYTKAQSDANINVKADKSNSLSGYGITNAYTKTEVDSLVSQKATKATTLSGYGITNAYTTTETDTLLNAKSNTTHTHTMSQITNLPALAPSDAQKNSDITKAEIEAKLIGQISTHTHNYNNYVHPTGNGSNHIPSGGSIGKILGWNSDGDAKWQDNIPIYANDTVVPEGINLWIDTSTDSPAFDFVSKADIVNNLTSTVTNQPLSAAQGRELKTQLDTKLSKTETAANSFKWCDLVARILTQAEYNAVEKDPATFYIIVG